MMMHCTWMDGNPRIFDSECSECALYVCMYVLAVVVRDGWRNEGRKEQEGDVCCCWSLLISQQPTKQHHQKRNPQKPKMDVVVVFLFVFFPFERPSVGSLARYYHI